MDNEVKDGIYPLTEDAIELIRVVDMQAAALPERVNGILMLFCRQHKLTGQYRLSENRRELVQELVQDTPVALPEQK